MFSESSGLPLADVPANGLASEHQESAVWLENGLIALECLAQKQSYQTEAGIAANRFLKLVHASPFPDPGIITYRRQQRDAKTMVEASLAQARYHVALALGIEADDPSLPESGGNLNIKDPVKEGYLTKVFYDFLSDYDNQLVGGSIINIRAGREQLVLPRRLLEQQIAKPQEQEYWRSETPSSEPLLSEEIAVALNEWLSNPILVEPTEKEKASEEVFKTELTPTQRDIRQGAQYLLASQVSISITNGRETYDPLLHGRTAYKKKTDEKIAPALPEAKLREELRQFRTRSIVKFAGYCIIRSAEYIPVLREAGLLPSDYPDAHPENPEKTVELYRSRFAVPSDPERDKHRRRLRKVIASPKVRFVTQSGNQLASQGQQDQLF